MAAMLGREQPLAFPLVLEDYRAMVHVGRQLRVLLAEDNPTDADIVVEALHDVQPGAKVAVFEDGRSVRDHLLDSARGPASGRPDLILLDLNLPGVSGRQLLTLIKTDPTLQTIPVVVLSSSADPLDVSFAYRNCANCYVTKPADLDGFLEAVRKTATLWLDVAELPRPA